MFEKITITINIQRRNVTLHLLGMSVVIIRIAKPTVLPPPTLLDGIQFMAMATPQITKELQL